MMSRQQRIDYEILDCAVNGFRDSKGYATAATTTVPAFRKRLLVLFPDSVDQEFTDACKRLSKQGLLHLQKFDNELGGFCDYHDERDDVAFFGANSNVFCLRASVQSQKYFKQLSTLIDAPSGFKR
jgi:hypothetical protein